MASPRPQGFEALAERMEVIKPDEIQLVKFLGAGGYGGASRSPACRQWHWYRLCPARKLLLQRFQNLLASMSGHGAGSLPQLRSSWLRASAAADHIMPDSAEVHLGKRRG